MIKNSTSQDIDVFSKAIVTLAKDAASTVSGVKLVSERRSREAVKVSFLQNQKVQVDMIISIALGNSVPTTVAALQDVVKSHIEGATKFNVNSVNVHVSSVDAEQ